MPVSLTRAEIEPVLTGSAFHQFLGIGLDELTEETLTVRLPYNELFYTSADGYIHGGILSTLIDIAGYFAVFRFLDRPVPTLDLRIDYLRPGRAGDLLAAAKVVKLGRTVSIADITVTDTEGRQIAAGRGVFHSAEVRA
ncbi:PaaI family thioesterase [Saccharibacillus sp. CPCC 101409]|uniref:PaaI family thioesterase n=1 Tax=Saccharibacillus sp. CPCC 101409 TaxID=3058041 RepID=UPI002672C33E|nr:PaaI family thioesterase [Saccharibacillus sp. CPCC 101409]MDO3409273.1 PaaI family thioesterase [Saccharibacillus sp. CPCC 101409]